MDRLIGLVRVSTDKQGKSGLGLEAQHAAIEDHRRRTGATLLKVYVEVESGTHDDIDSRPQLRAAVSHARRSNAVLCIGKIDRLVRSTVVGAFLKQSGIRFLACDNPYANELTIDILIAVAADEGRRISTRTRESLAAYKAGKRISKRTIARYPDGVPLDVVEATAGKLGASLPQCRNLTYQARVKGASKAGLVHKKKADEAYGDIAGWMAELRREGLSQQAIAGRLNEEGHTLRSGRPWNQVQVMRVLRRFAV
jgi:DNA invertase Pin-like site-specific DNA recombinase